MMENNKFGLVEITLDSVETLEDTIAPNFGIFCAGCTNSAQWGIWCG